MSAKLCGFVLNSRMRCCSVENTLRDMGGGHDVSRGGSRTEPKHCTQCATEAASQYLSSFIVLSLQITAVAVKFIVSVFLPIVNTAWKIMFGPVCASTRHNARRPSIPRENGDKIRCDKDIVNVTPTSYKQSNPFTESYAQQYTSYYSHFLNLRCNHVNQP